MPERPYTQPNKYIETSYPTQRVIKELHAAGKLNAVQELWMAPHKPGVEFYDTQADPFEVHNLAGAREHRPLVQSFAARLNKWMLETKDLGGIPESKEELDQWIR
jgi:hypothetical protein